MLNLKFHHFGLALMDDSSALPFLDALGYKVSDKIYDEEQNVHLRMAENDAHPAVEIVLPGIGDGPLTPILKRHSELIYHLCYETDDLGNTLSFLADADIDYMEISAPKPAILFGGDFVSFYRVRGIGLIEIISPA